MDFGSGLAARPSLLESPPAEGAGTSASFLWMGGGIGVSGRGGSLMASRLSGVGDGGGDGVGGADAAAATSNSIFAPPSLPAPVPQQQPRSPEEDALDLMSDLW